MTIKMRRSRLRWLPLALLAVALSWTINAVSAATDNSDQHESDGGHKQDNLISLSAEQIRRAGIVLEKVGSASVRQTLPLYGKIVANDEREHAVSARFPGVIRQLTKRVGDQVAKGETLAIVESNESLKPYSIVASLSGIVAERHANVGEQTSGRTLYVIGDYSTVWVDIAVFPGDLAKVRVGQQVRVVNGDVSLVGEGRVISVSPVGKSASQTTTVRALLENPARHWVPGHFVSAELVLSETLVPIAIQEEAVQVLEDQSVVFVATDEGFEARPVTLGRGDGVVREVLAGLAAQEAYVTTNSFILKSELGKGDSDHGH